MNAISDESNKTHLIVTVHGIRTLGDWQERLAILVKDHAPNPHEIEFRHFKYGFFSVLQYMCPPLRWFRVIWFRWKLKKLIKSRDWERVDIVAHSFGTHMVGFGLKKLKLPDGIQIHTVILAGSVLKPQFPWETMIGSKVRRVINECGRNDSVLILNLVAVLFSGAAGRFGFIGALHDRFWNRFNDFGHSGYFEPELGNPNSDKDTFMRENWLPLLLSSYDICAPTPYTPTAIQGAWNWVLSYFEPLKIAIYISPLIFLVIYINNLRISAIEAYLHSESQRLALLANRELDAGSPDRSALLSVEAMKAMGTTEAYSQLLQVSNNSPHLMKVLRYPGASKFIWTAVSSDRATVVGLGASPGGLARSVFAWDIENGRMEDGFPVSLVAEGKPTYESVLESVAFDPLNKILYRTNRNQGFTTIHSHQIGRPNQIRSEIECPENITSLDISPDGKTMAIVTMELNLYTFPVDSDKERLSIFFKNRKSDDFHIYKSLKEHLPKVLLNNFKSTGGSHVKFSFDSKRIAILTLSGMLAIVDLENGLFLRGFPLIIPPPKEYGLDFFYATKLAFNGAGDTVYAHDSANYVTKIVRVEGGACSEHKGFFDFCFGRENSVYFDVSKNLRTFDKRLLTGSHGQLTSISCDPSGRLVSGCGWDGQIFIWDTKRNLRSPIFRGDSKVGVRGGVRSIEFFDSDQKLLISNDIGPVDIYHREDGEGFVGLKSYGFEEMKVSGYRTCSVVNSNFDLIITGIGVSDVNAPIGSGGGALYVSNTRSGVTKEFPVHESPVRSLTLNSDGKKLVSADQNGTIIISEIVEGGLKEIKRKKIDTTFLFAADFRDASNEVLVLNQSGLSKWNVVSDEVSHFGFDKQTINVTQATLIGFSDVSGVQIAIGSANGQVMLLQFDGEKMSLSDRFPAHSDAVTSLHFSRSGNLLASGSANGSAILWKLRKEKLGSPIELTSSGGNVGAFAFSEDESLLSFGEENGNVFLYYLNQSDLVERCKILTGRNMTIWEWERYMGRESDYRKTFQTIDPGLGVTE